MYYIIFVFDYILYLFNRNYHRTRKLPILIDGYYFYRWVPGYKKYYAYAIRNDKLYVLSVSRIMQVGKKTILTKDRILKYQSNERYTLSKNGVKRRVDLYHICK